MKEYDKTESYNNYGNNALNQNIASMNLIELIKPYITDKTTIIDIGCGNGKNTFDLSKLTKSTVIGLDASNGMIESCKNKYNSQKNLMFLVKNIENYTSQDKFDIIFSNSVIHWFVHPQKTIQNIANITSKYGYFALQTPTKTWCPLLIECIENTMQSEEILSYAKTYRSPWFHLNNADEYQSFLLDNGYSTIDVKLDIQVTNPNCSRDDIYKMFLSGPAAAYLNQDNYSKELPYNFKDLFFINLLKEISKLTRNDSIDVTYHRAFIIAGK